MMENSKKESKTIRISEEILNRLAEQAQSENRSVSNVIETIFLEYYAIMNSNELGKNETRYLPIHMQNSNIYSLISWAKSIVSNSSNCCEVKVRKHHDKGIAFCMVYFNYDSNNDKIFNRMYTFSVDPNWEILDFFEHWLQVNEIYNTEVVDKPKKLNMNVGAKNVLKEIKEFLQKKGEPEINTIFKTDSWVEIYSNKEKFLLENE